VPGRNKTEQTNNTIKSSLFTDEQNELLTLIFQNHTSQIREFLSHRLKEIDDKLEKEFYDAIDKLNETKCKYREEQIIAIDKKLEVLDVQFKLKSSIWGLLGGAIPTVAMILLYFLMKAI
jgi:hypothetical protein